MWQVIMSVEDSLIAHCKRAEIEEDVATYNKETENISVRLWNSSNLFCIFRWNFHTFNFWILSNNLFVVKAREKFSVLLQIRFNFGESFQVLSIWTFVPKIAEQEL